MSPDDAPTLTIHGTADRYVAFEQGQWITQRLREAGVPAATRLMADDHYGWFERLERGVYELSPRGKTEPTLWRRRIEEAET